MLARWLDRSRLISIPYNRMNHKAFFLEHGISLRMPQHCHSSPYMGAENSKERASKLRNQSIRIYQSHNQRMTVLYVFLVGSELESLIGHTTSLSTKRTHPSSLHTHKLTSRYGMRTRLAIMSIFTSITGNITCQK